MWRRGRVNSRRVRRDVRALTGNSFQQRLHLGGDIATVTPQRAHTRQFASLGPPRDGLRINAEHSGDLRRCQQRLSLLGGSDHACEFDADLCREATVSPDFVPLSGQLARSV